MLGEEAVVAVVVDSGNWSRIRGPGFWLNLTFDLPRGQDADSPRHVLG